MFLKGLAKRKTIDMQVSMQRYVTHMHICVYLHKGYRISVGLDVMGKSVLDYWDVLSIFL